MANTIQIVIAAKDAASDVVEGVLGSLGDLGEAGAKALLGLAAAATAVGGALFELAREAAPIQLVKNAFDRLTGSGRNATDMIKRLTAASAGFLDDSDLMAMYNKAAMELGDTLAGKLPDAMEALRRIAGATGEDLKTLTDSFMGSVEALQPRALKQMGIILDLNQVYADYAASIGKSTDELTTQEQQTAFMNAALTALQSRAAQLPDVVNTAAQSWAIFGNTLNNLKEDIGTAFLPVFKRIVDGFNDLVQKYGPPVVAFVQDLASKIEIGMNLVGAWLNVGLIIFQSWFNAVKDKFDTFLAGPIGDFIAMFTTGNFSQLPTVLGNLFDNITKLFWDSLAHPIGDALASITPTDFMNIILGVVGIGAAFLIANIPVLIGNISTALLALVGILGGPLTLAIGLAILLVAAYENNWLGFKTTVDAIGKWLTGPFVQFLSKFRDAVQMFMTDPLATVRDLIVDVTQKLFTLQNNPLLAIVTGGAGIPAVNANSTQAGANSGVIGQTTGLGTGRDSGGRGHAGQPYYIGTGAQPEVFVPDSSGSFYPNGGSHTQVDTLQVIFNGGGAPRNDQEADDSVRMLAAALRARGIQI